MAGCDYRRCDVCGEKAFYDANLNYTEGKSEYRETTAFRIAGAPQPGPQESLDKWGMRLDYLGDWAVICDDCAKTHKCVVVKLEDGE